jgi:hypothetical protein
VRSASRYGPGRSPPVLDPGSGGRQPDQAVPPAILGGLLDLVPGLVRPACPSAAGPHRAGVGGKGAEHVQGGVGIGEGAVATLQRQRRAQSDQRVIRQPPAVGITKVPRPPGRNGSWR